MNKRESILKRIHNLLNRTEEKGASKSEAKIALEKAGKLMSEYNITELDLQKINETYFKKEEIKFKRQSITDLLTTLGDAFDCIFTYKSIYNVGYYFGFELDVKMCVHFAIMLDDILEKEIKEYKKSYEYYKLKWNYQPTAIIKNFVAGFSEEVEEKLKELKRQREIVEVSNGTSLMVIKSQQVSLEFEKLFNPKIVKTPELILIKSAYLEGANRGESIQFNKPIEECNNNLLKLETIKKR